MRKLKLLIVLVAIGSSLLLYKSCTYDYFIDETNYWLVVPEVRDDLVNDCRVLVYNKAGALVAEKHAVAPFSTNPRYDRGEFVFRLPPDEYKIYCYTDGDSLEFRDLESHSTSAFQLRNHFRDGHLQEPPELHFQTFNREVIHQGIRIVDTAKIERYVGRITVRFKEFPVDPATVKSVQFTAHGIASVQLLNQDTITTRISAEDKSWHQNDLGTLVVGDPFDVSHFFMPSIENEMIYFDFNFLDSASDVITSFRIDVADLNTGMPLRLLHGRHVLVEVENFVVTSVGLVGWDDDILEIEPPMD